MNLGITFEEKILIEIDQTEYMNFIKKNRLSFLEFAPNFSKYSYEFYKNIFNGIINSNIKIKIHLPHFIDENLDISNFSNKNKLKLIEFYNSLNDLIDLSKNNIILVFHGAKYETISKDEALSKTNAFIKFSLQFFNENNYLVNLSIETLNTHHHKVIGDNREDLINIVKSFNNKIGICFDITHDYLNLEEITFPSKEFLSLVNHSHIHGFNKDNNHLPVYKNEILFDMIKLLKKNNYPINIEMLLCDNYLNELQKDIDLINSFR
ncbi:TIM barrel protein [Clostridiaceae bacterium HSG29]|nr:TIM barrel protein [Clostridiaceae bacterium HSG29]